jgi:hypothetical protein
LTNKKSGNNKHGRKRGRAIKKSSLNYTLKVVFPQWMGPIEMRKFLMDLEQKGVRAAESKMESDVRQLRPFDWSVEKRKLNDWATQARSEATTGNNWQSSGHTHIFREGRALRQLRNIGLSGWGSN